MSPVLVCRTAARPTDI